MLTTTLRHFGSRILGTLTVLATVFSGLIAAPAAAEPVAQSVGAPQSIQQSDPANPNKITGIVTDGNGDPMVGLLVQTLSPADYIILDAVFTDDTGAFDFPTMNTGSYKMQFADYEAGEVLAFFDNAVNYDNADLVTVSDTEGAYVEMVIGEPTGVGTAGGSLFDVDGAAVEGVQVNLLTTDGELVTSTTTNVDGNYNFDSLLDNTYTVCFSASGYVDTCYGGADDYSTADTFDITDGSDVTLSDSTILAAGTISGRVTTDDDTAGPLEGVSVSAYGFNGYFWSVAATAVTDINGGYSINGVPEGTYFVVADPESTEPEFEPEWYPNATRRDHGNSVVVEAGLTTELIDFALPVGGSISVTAYCGDASTVCETAFVAIDALDGTLPESSRGYDVTETQTFTGLPDGRYKVRLSTSDTNEVYAGGNGTFEASDTITIVDGNEVVGLYHLFDAATQTATVGGTVSGFSGDSTYVRLLGESPYDWEAAITVDEMWTDETGDYEFTVEPGRYTIQFGETEVYDDEGNVRSAQSYWGGAYRLARATWFDVAADAVLDYDFTAPTRGATISGTVKNNASPAVGQSGVIVTLTSPNGTATAVTTAGGAYSVTDLAPGVYTLSMDGDGLTSTWNRAVTSRPTINAASATGTYTLNGTMAVASRTLTGRVTGSGSAITEYPVYVFARRKTDECAVSVAEADEDGYYSLTGLSAGTFSISASTTEPLYCEMAGGYTPTPDSNWMPVSADVTIAATGTIPAKNFALGVGGKVRGSATTPTGEPVAEGTLVFVYGLSDQYVQYGEVDSDGDYEVVGLATGAYYVQVAEASSSGPGWWTNGTRARVPVNVSAAGTTSNVNIVASTGSTVSGTISSADGRPINGYLQAFDVNGLPVGYAEFTDNDEGEYSITSLPDGPIRISFTVSGRTFWVGGGTSLATAAVTYVGSGSVATARELSIPNFGSVSGLATVGGLGEAGTVMLIDSSGRQVATDNTSDGTYNFENVVAGAYTVRYISDGNEMVWFGNKDSLATANYFTVSAGVAAEGIDLNAAAATTAFTPGAVTTTGTLAVGQVLTAKAGTWTPTPTAIQYRWTRDWNDVAISTAATYTVTAADIGKTIRVEIVVSKSGVKSDYMTITMGRVNAIALTAAPTPVISPATAPKVGTLLTAKPGKWTPATVSFSYQWLRAGVPIDGATASTYTTTADDIGSRISVRVVGTKAGYLGAMKDSAQLPTTVAATLTTTPTPTVTVTGGKQPGGVLTASAGTWAPALVGLSYQWKRGSAAIPGANSPVYTLTSEDVGASITVAVTGSKVGYTSVTKASSAVTGITSGAGLVGATPTISGTLSVGNTLTAAPGTWSDGATLSYQWVRDGKAIAGATSSTYVLTGADHRSSIRVRVKGTLSGTTLTKVSAASSAVAVGTFTAPVEFEWSGVFTFESTIVADSLTLNAPAKVSYQWLRNGVPIAGATKRSYTLGYRDIGREISVRATATAKGYTTLVVESASVLFAD